MTSGVYICGKYLIPALLFRANLKCVLQVFEGNSPPGHIKIDSVLKALTTYGSEQLSEEQAHDLVSQVKQPPSQVDATLEASPVYKG